MQVRLLLVAACVVFAAIGCGEDSSGGGDARSVADSVVASFAREDFKAIEAMVSEDAKGTLNEANLKSVWTQTVAKFGAYKDKGEPKAGTFGAEGELFDYPLTFERSKHHLQVVLLASSAEVVGLMLRAGEPTGEWRK